MTDHGTPVGPPDPPPPPPPGATDALPPPPDLAEQLAAEQAGVAYWRAVAADRRSEAARVQRRPLVRVAVAVDRRTAALQRSVARGGRAAAAAAGQAAVVAAGLGRRPGRRARHAELAAQLARQASDATPADDRTVLVVHLGPAPIHTASPLVERAQPTDAAIAAGGRVLAEEVNALVEASDAPLVCLLAPTAEPVHRGWLARLVAPVDGDVVAAVPLVLHPERPLREATAHDLLVRSAGLGIDVVDGAPVAVARRAGEPPDLSAPGEDVVAAPATALVVARSAWRAAGGLGGQADLDAAVFDLCARLGHHGTIRSVPAAVVADHASVRSSAELSGPLVPDGAPWRRIVDAHGPALVRRAHPAEPGRWTVAVTTATPSRKIAAVSGDWHYAGLFAGALTRAGHTARVSTIDQADGLADRACDLRVVLRGLEPVRRTSGQRHVLWVISHPEALESAECDDADLVVVASHRYAAHLRTLTDTPVEVLLQATDPGHFRPVTPDVHHRHRVTVVANTRGFPRAAVADALAGGLGPTVHGTGWAGLVPPDTICADYVPFDELATVYSSAEVVLNDHWETMRRWGFLSNRVFDVLACGTPVVSDDLPEVQELFGDLVPTWASPEQLRDTVVALLAQPRRTAERVAEARALVLGSHTMDHRVAELTELLERHDLVPGTGPGG